MTTSYEGAAATDIPVPVPARARRLHLRRLLALADALAIVVALAAAVLIGGEAHPLTRFAWGLAPLPIWIVLFKVYGLYDRDGKRVSHSTVEEVPWIFHSLVLGTLGLWVLYKALATEQLILVEVLAFFAVALASTLFARAAVRRIARVSMPPERVLLVGGGPTARVLERKVQAHPEYGLELIGRLAVDEGDPTGTGRFTRFLGDLSRLEAVCEDRSVERVLVVASSVEADVLTDLIRRSKSLDVRISLVPDLVDVLGPSVEIDDIEGITVLGMSPPRLTRSSRALKRAMDVALASGALLVLLPFLVVTAITVRLTSPGPAVFRQERVGRQGRRFRLYKFRTMVEDAEDHAEGLRGMSAHPAWLLLDHDPRVTRVGRLLRLTSVDELPQLWNVVKGDMSLVGPRPILPTHHEHVPEWGRRRLDLTPGITGLWQVLGRTAIPFEEMVKLDYLYVTNWSLWYDVRLLIQTFPILLSRRGAN